MKQSKRDNIQ